MAVTLFFFFFFQKKKKKEEDWIGLGYTRLHQQV